MVAGALIAGIATAGTYAFRDSSQFRQNELRGGSANFSVSLDEYFVPREDWKKGEVVDKPIYVHNLGDIPAYARLRWEEALTTQEVAYTTTEAESKKFAVDPSTGKFYVWHGDDADKNAGPDAVAAALEKIYPAIPAITGALTTTPARITFNEHGFEWRTDFLTGIEGWYVRDKAGAVNGQWGRYMATGKKAVASPAAVSDAREYVEWKYAANVKTWDEWVAAGMPSGAFWIIGKDNNYAYWAQALKPKSNTEFFLSQMELLQQPEGDFNYDLKFFLDAVSGAEFDAEWCVAGEWERVPDEIRDMLFRKTVVKTRSELYDALDAGDEFWIDGTIDTDHTVYDHWKKNSYTIFGMNNAKIEDVENKYPTGLTIDGYSSIYNLKGELSLALKNVTVESKTAPLSLTNLLLKPHSASTIYGYKFKFNVDGGTYVYTGDTNSDGGVLFLTYSKPDGTFKYLCDSSTVIIKNATLRGARFLDVREECKDNTIIFENCKFFLPGSDKPLTDKDEILNHMRFDETKNNTVTIK